MKTSTKLFTTVAVALLVTLGAAQDYYDEEPAPRRPAPRPAPSASFSSSGSGPKPTPVPILKQINRHNEDGSYTYGYEGADGTFKIETKLPNGEVKGKYGYLDDVGKVHVVEYGANKYGFQPVGEGITVASPTLVDETVNKDGSINAEYAEYERSHYEPQSARAQPRPRPVQQEFDFQNAPRYAQAPAPAPVRTAAPAPPRPHFANAAPVEIDYTAPAPRFAPGSRPAPVHTFSPAPVARPAPRPAPVQEDISYAQPAPAPRPQPQFRPAPQPQFRPAPQPQFRPAPQPQFAPQPRPASVQPQPGRGGVLDQLARDYALPQDSAAPLHDISFGYY